MQNDIIFHMLKFVRENNGVFKKSLFKYIANPLKTWWDAPKLLDHRVASGYIEKTRPEGKRAYMYYLAPKGYNVLEMWGL